MNKTSDVAVIGAGIMGTAIATRLLETGNRVRVFDLDKDKITKLAERGAAASKSPGEATKDSDFVILSLNHADIVRNVVFGQNGVATAATAGKRSLTCLLSIQLRLRKWQANSRLKPA